MLPLTDIAIIKIIKGPYFAGDGGAIAINTIRGEDEGEESAKK